MTLGYTLEGSLTAIGASVALQPVMVAACRAKASIDPDLNTDSLQKTVSHTQRDDKTEGIRLRCCSQLLMGNVLIGEVCGKVRRTVRYTSFTLTIC